MPATKLYTAETALSNACAVGALGTTFGTAAGTFCQGNDSRVVAGGTAVQPSTNPLLEDTTYGTSGLVLPTLIHERDTSIAVGADANFATPDIPASTRYGISVVIDMYGGGLAELSLSVGRMGGAAPTFHNNVLVFANANGFKWTITATVVSNHININVANVSDGNPCKVSVWAGYWSRPAVSA